MAQAPTATQEPTPQPGDAPTPNQPVALTITCAELKALFKAGDKRTAGAAILWLDGYYAGRSGLSELPAGWARTVSQGVGGTCAITVNDDAPFSMSSANSIGNTGAQNKLRLRAGIRLLSRSVALGPWRQFTTPSSHRDGYLTPA
jgi:hypothetical protein